ncbi:hypothetical protein PDIDSM_8772 [Penicillium digitatum]|nr:hypothetical protein PDIDSM_8772 [Penicillium digitatum]
MASISSAAEAVARIAYLTSDTVISVQPSLQDDSLFSKSLKALKAKKTRSLSSKATEETVRYNEDPLLSAFTPLQNGETTSVVTSSSVLITAVPHLYRLANSPVVIHVALEPSPFPDYSVISSIRQSGFTFLHSETVQEAQDIAITAHALSQKTGKGVIHFFDPFNSAKDPSIPEEDVEVVKKVLSVGGNTAISAGTQTLYADSGRVATVTEETVGSSPTGQPEPANLTVPSQPQTPFNASVDNSSVGSSRRDSSAGSDVASSTATTVDSVVVRPIHAGDIFEWTARIWNTLFEEVGRRYNAIEYTGVSDAKSAIFVFGSTGVFVDALANVGANPELENIGLITARLYRPWVGGQISNSIPSSIEKIAVLEQVRKTTRWGPSFMDLLSSLTPSGARVQAPQLVGYCLGYIESSTAVQALRGVLQNLNSASPIQNLDIGSSQVPTVQQALEQPRIENAYLKILNQLFGERLHIANQLGSNNAGVSSIIAASPEFGFGSLLARQEHRQRFIREVEEATKSSAFATDAPKTWLSRWALNVKEAAKANKLAPDVISRLSTDGSALSRQLLQSKNFFYEESDWLIGSDAWAYDFGNSGVHHVLASGANVNMLIIDSQPFSERAASDATRRKKDIGLYAMNRGNAYVASVAVYSSNDSALTVLQETKKAIDLGYWPCTAGTLTEREGIPPRDNQLTQLMNAPKYAPVLSESYGTRGLKTMVIAMDEFPLEDLPTEENVVFITSTAGQGEFPVNGRALWEYVKNTGDLDLSAINYSVFGLGDSHYWPRKEDKIYYNKPGKDLDDRVAFLGGRKLTDIGLGDDQDPDAYQTGYSEWEPRLWKSLGVDKVEGLPEEPAPITNEDIKVGSNFLRGTIAEALLDESTGSIPASDQQLTKFHGTYMQDDRDLRDERKAQGLEPAYSFMIRCRLPGGVDTPKQWLQMDAISSSYGNETMKLTTRQTFQFHGVIKRNLRSAMRAINSSMMDTLAACGDVNRNVMCSSLPELSSFHRETWAISTKISQHLLPSTSAYHEIWLKDDNDKKVQVAGDAIVDHEPIYGPTYLPRKFKITIAIPPRNDTDVYAHDIGLIAIKGADGHLEGFNVLAGGGMGTTHNNTKTYPQTGRMFGYIPADKIHLACEKIMLVQRDNGDRKNRKHARMKYTIDDMGVETFRSEVEKLLPGGLKFGEPRPFEFKSNVDTFGWIKDDAGLNHFTFFIENGRIEDSADFKMRTGLRELAQMGKGEFRLTGNQHLIISRIADEDLPAIKEHMAKYKLDNTAFSGLRLSSSACVAFPTCGLAMAESERYLPVLISKLESTLEECGLARDSIVMRKTGCPNGCARPWLAEVAFVGKAYGAYNMYLGGGYHGQRLNKRYRSSIKEDEIIDIMKGLLKRYSLERDTDGETPERFGDWCIRAGVIKTTTDGQNFHDGVAEDEEEE